MLTLTCAEAGVTTAVRRIAASSARFTSTSIALESSRQRRVTMIGATGVPHEARISRYTDRARRRRLGDRRSRQRGGRKVRAPQGRVLGNSQGGQPHGQCHRKQTAARKSGKGETVR